MTDQIPTPAVDLNDIMARYAAYEARAAELHPANKTSLFSALGHAGITSVTVVFDGGGDSGQIESIEAKAGDANAVIPSVSVELAHAEFGTEEIARRTEPLADAIETLCYALLQERHGGWENNEGGWGEFLFNVAAATITLDFNYRIETSENHVHEL